MNSCIIHDNICSLIRKKCHPNIYHSDNKYHMALSIIFSVLHTIHVFIHYCCMIIFMNDYLVHFYWGLYLSYRFFKTQCSWSAHIVPFVLLFGLWLSYYDLVFVCLMQSLGYMLGMRQYSMTFLLESQSGFCV
jgi:hypothetical protein